MKTNGDITLYNRRYSKDTRSDVWCRTVLHNVWIYTDNKIQLSDSGVKTADVFKIRIPAHVSTNKEYVSEDAWQTVDADECWTLQQDDCFCIGEGPEISAPSDLEKLRARSGRIFSWSDNRFGSQPHWRIEGK